METAAAVRLIKSEFSVLYVHNGTYSLDMNRSNSVNNVHHRRVAEEFEGNELTCKRVSDDSMTDICAQYAGKALLKSVDAFSTSNSSPERPRGL